MPAKQRKRWEQKAAEAKAAHKKQYPDYRYTPVHRKGPSRKKAKKEQKKDDARCEELAQLLLGGAKGAELEERVKKLDESNPDSYQTTLSFTSPAEQQSQQFTFVQGFPAAGHSIQVPSAPTMYLPHHYNPNQPRRHSSAPPADNAFLDGGHSSSSTASTPRTTSRDLSLHTEADLTSPTDSLIPLSRIARKLPTKSTHHLQPHHFRDEADIRAAAANPKKIKSSMSKAVRSRAQGFGAPQPASERDQLFIQSHWTNAAMDPSASTSGEKKKRNRRQDIPEEMLIAPWDLKDTTHSGNASPNITSHTSLPAGFVPVEQYNSSYGQAYSADDKYSQYDGAGVGPFDLITYQDYGLSGLEMDPLTSGDLTDSAALNAALNGAGALGGFDFADQFGALGVDADTKDDYVRFIYLSFLKPHVLINKQGYNSYFTRAVELGSGPGSANSSSPHNSDADDAAAFHPYDNVPAPLTMAAQDPLGGYQSTQHQIVYSAPDWSAFNSTTAVQAAPEVDPLDPLSAPPPSSATAGNGSFDHFAYPPLPNSGPPSECGDADEYGEPSSYVSHSPVVHAPAFRQQQQPMQLSLNMQYVPPGSAPGSAASYDYSHVHALDYAHHQHQYSPAASSATSPITGNMSAVDHMGHYAMDMSMNMASNASPIRTASSPVVYHHPHSHAQVMMHPAGHHIQHISHPSQHMHTHSHSHSMESFHEPMLQSGHEQPQQWGEWTHPDPFRQSQADGVHNTGATNSFDPLATGSSAIVDAYRG